MTCSHCCGAEKIFNDKESSKMLRRYRKKGPGKTTLRLLNGIGIDSVSGKTLLDIGGGVGAIQQELLGKDLKASVGVDASLSYITAAKQLSKEKGNENRMTFIHGDFLNVQNELENQDLVTLEKVVCCYPHIKDLIMESSRKSTELYGLVYPFDHWFNKFIVAIGNLYLRLVKNPFRSYIHSEKMMHSMIQQNGFERIHYSSIFPWKVAVYRRV